MEAKSRLKDFKVVISESNLIKHRIEVAEKDGIEYIKVKLFADEDIIFPKVKIEYKYPLKDISSYWNPGSAKSKGYSSVWEDPHDLGGFSSKATSLAPVGCFFGTNNENRLTIAFSDALNPVRFVAGVCEEDANVHGKIVLFKEPTKKMRMTEFVLRVDTRNIPYYAAINDVASWYETLPEYKPSIPPEVSRLPMYSTWYSFHQELNDVEIEKECEYFKSAGCYSVIVDDGWQTDDNRRGYAFCGDWEVAKSKMNDMKEHVKRIHKLGMKYLLWYSVPFLGKKSTNWNTFKDKILYVREDLEAGVLDPRYKAVRDFLILTYEKALIEWDIDGFKLDFLDDFRLVDSKEKLNLASSDRDYDSLQEAVDRLLTDVMSHLKKIKPDIMIEFRQAYIGPYMRKYGNMFRVVDCPASFTDNRIGIIDLRLLSGNTAVHSDMLMWSPETSVEHASLHIINVLFGVPQVSIKHNNYNEMHNKMIRHWLAFWNQHRNTLLSGSLKPLFPDMQYPLVRAENQGEEIVVAYGDMVIEIEDNFNKLILVNGAMLDRFIVKVKRRIGQKKLVQYDCCGELTGQDVIYMSEGLLEIKVDKSGLIILQ